MRTDLGDLVFLRAESIIREVAQLSEDAQMLSKSPTGQVVLGVLPSMVAPMIVDLYAQLQSTAPGITLRVYEGFSDQIERWIAEGFVDIGILGRYRVSQEAYDEKLFDSDLLLVSRSSNDFISSPIDFRDLCRFPLVLSATLNGLSVTVRALAHKLDVALNVVFEADSLSAQKDAVLRCGCHMLVFPEAFIGQLASAGLSARSIVDPVIRRRVVLATSRQRPLTRAARTVIDRVKTVIVSPDVTSMFAEAALRPCGDRGTPV